MEKANQRLGALNEQLNPHANPKFKYTQDCGPLTPEQRQFYEDNGFIIIKALFPKEDIRRYDERFAHICRHPDERPFAMTIVRDVGTLKKGEKIDRDTEFAIHKVQDWQDDPILFEYCKHPKILEYVKNFCGPDIKTVHTMLINKPPHVGATTRHPLHQDLLYFPFRPYNTIVCSWTAMIPINRENGGLVVVPGSHKAEKLLPHGYPKWEGEGGVNKFYFGIIDVPKDVEFFHAEMDVGDTIFFHPLLYHGSGANKTDVYRRSISCHYSSSKAKYEDLKDTLQEEFSRELEEVAKKKLGLPKVNYSDIWKLKVRQVAGVDYEDCL